MFTNLQNAKIKDSLWFTENEIYIFNKKGMKNRKFSSLRAVHSTLFTSSMSVSFSLKVRQQIVLSNFWIFAATARNSISM